MDRLRSPGGCPWDAEQTHRSLTRYLLEETYEVIEAVETDDSTLLREELGDLLLQVLFHARLAQELPPADAFGIDDVADDLSHKLVRRHPHVFGPDADAQRPPGAVDVDALNDTWERNKIAEKGRTSALDGVPLDQPALALTAKLVARARRAGLPLDAAPNDHATTPSAADPHRAVEAAAAADIGSRLFALVREAVDAGVDPEGALRATTRAYREALRTAEGAAADGSGDST